MPDRQRHTATPVGVDEHGEVRYFDEEHVEVLPVVPRPSPPPDAPLRRPRGRSYLEVRVELERAKRLSTAEKRHLTSRTATPEERGAAEKKRAEYANHLLRLRRLAGASIVLARRPLSQDWIVHAPLTRGSAKGAEARARQRQAALRGASRADAHVTDSRVLVARMTRFERWAPTAMTGHAARGEAANGKWVIGCCTDPEALARSLREGAVGKDLYRRTRRGSLFSDIVDASEPGAEWVHKRDRVQLQPEVRAAAAEILTYASWVALAGPGDEGGKDISPASVMSRVHHYVTNQMNRRFLRVQTPRSQSPGEIKAEIVERAEQRQEELDIIPLRYRDPQEAVREARDLLTALAPRPKRGGRPKNAAVLNRIEQIKALASLSRELTPALRRESRVCLERIARDDGAHTQVRSTARVALRFFPVDVDGEGEPESAAQPPPRHRKKPR